MPTLQLDVPALDELLQQLQQTLSIRNVLLVGIGAWVLPQFYSILRFLVRPFISPLRIVAGPPNPNFVGGHVQIIRESENSVQEQEKWVEAYGHVVKCKAFLNADRLLLLDMRGVQHVLNNTQIYEKPWFIRQGLARILGHGLLFSEGDDHKRQRRIMTPSFTVSHLREMTDIFVSKSAELRDALTEQLQTSTSGSARVEMLQWLSRTTLDIIGLAGFNYTFDAIKHGEEGSELSWAFSKIFQSDNQSIGWFLAQGYFPILNHLRFDGRSVQIRQSRAAMHSIGLQLVKSKQDALRDEFAAGSTGKGKDRDLLSLMIRSNMAPDVAPEHRLSVEQILHQIPTFIVAGHETTSTSTSWALFALARYPHFQRKLRKELQEFPHENPTMDELNSLTYLDAVVRETMRNHPAVEGTIRVAVKDDVIPLDKPFVDVNGVVRHELRIAKGDALNIPIAVINRLPSIWGEDSKVFNPERWFTEVPLASTIPGVWGNSLAFLGGGHACIGFKFAVTEMKALLFQLIRSFEFELAVPWEDVGGKPMIVTRPYLRSEPGAGNQIPFIIRPATSS